MKKRKKEKGKTKEEYHNESEESGKKVEDLE